MTRIVKKSRWIESCLLGSVSPELIEKSKKYRIREIDMNEEEPINSERSITELPPLKYSQTMASMEINQETAQDTTPKSQATPVLKIIPGDF